MSTPRYAQVAAVAVHLPPDSLTTPELEDLLAERNPGLDFRRGLIEDLTGVRSRHVSAPDVTASDLAVAAAEDVLRQTGYAASAIDLIIYAGVSADAVEPATGHMVAAKLGAGCPVFDVRNACNSVLNAMEVADLFITSGRHRTVLIACGEVVTKAMRWRPASQEEFLVAIPSYTVSDSGTALLLQAGDTPGILGHRFCANSADWEVSAMPFVCEGPGRIRFGDFAIDSVGLAVGVQKLDLETLRRPLDEHGFAMTDVAAICVHQPSLPAMRWFCELSGVPQDKVEVTIIDHGNLAASTLPAQLHAAVQAGRVRRGDLVALVGVASGLSAGTVLLRW